MTVQPATGFQVASVHSIDVSAMAVSSCQSRAIGYHIVFISVAHLVLSFVVASSRVPPSRLPGADAGNDRWIKRSLPPTVVRDSRKFNDSLRSSRPAE